MAKNRKLKGNGSLVVHRAGDFSLVHTLEEVREVARAHTFPHRPITLRPVVKHPCKEYVGEYIVSTDRCVARTGTELQEMFRTLVGKEEKPRLLKKNGIWLIALSDAPLVAITAWPGK